MVRNLRLFFELFWQPLTALKQLRDRAPVGFALGAAWVMTMVYYVIASGLGNYAMTGGAGYRMASRAYGNIFSGAVQIWLGVFFQAGLVAALIVLFISVIYVPFAILIAVAVSGVHMKVASEPSGTHSQNLPRRIKTVRQFDPDGVGGVRIRWLDRAEHHVPSPGLNRTRKVPVARGEAIDVHVIGPRRTPAADAGRTTDAQVDWWVRLIVCTGAVHVDFSDAFGDDELAIRGGRIAGRNCAGQRE